MPDVDVSSIKDAIALAKDLERVREARATAQTPPPLRLPRAAHRASRQAFAAMADKCGLDQQAFERNLAAQQGEVLRAHDAARAEAIERSGAVAAELRRQVETRRKALESVLAAPGSQPVLEALDSPFLIWATPANMLADAQILPWNSFARFQFESGDDYGQRDVTFYYLWENPSDRYAVVNVDGFLILNGFCRAHQDGDWYPGDRWTDLTITSAMSLLEWWNQPPTSPIPQPDQSQQALFLDARGSESWGDDGATASATLFRGYDLRHTLFLVPPHGVSVIEVRADIFHRSGEDGSHKVLLDFASGDFAATSPFVLIGVLT